MAEAEKRTRKSHKSLSRPHKVEERPPPSWATLKCISPEDPPHANREKKQKKKKKKKKEKQQLQQHGMMRCSVSICNTRETSEVMHRPEAFSSKDNIKSSHTTAFNSRNGSRKMPLTEINGPLPSPHSAPSKVMTTSPSSSHGAPSKGVQFRRFSGCYECHSVVDPISAFAREPSLRSVICTCPDCGQIFMKPESLELHQAVRHAVSELGPEDTSRNIVEIIFQSSWRPSVNRQFLVKLEEGREGSCRRLDWPGGVSSDAASCGIAREGGIKRRSRPSVSCEEEVPKTKYLIGAGAYSSNYPKKGHPINVVGDSTVMSNSSPQFVTF